MTADQAVARQASQECKAQKALRLLEALERAGVYIEFGDVTIGREMAEMVGGGGSDSVWVVDTYAKGGVTLISRDAYGTLAEAIAKATGEKQ